VRASIRRSSSASGSSSAKIVLGSRVSSVQSLSFAGASD
jgi:hypothetical protein